MFLKYSPPLLFKTFWRLQGLTSPVFNNIFFLLMVKLSKLWKSQWFPLPPVKLSNYHWNPENTLENIHNFQYSLSNCQTVKPSLNPENTLENPNNLHYNLLNCQTITETMKTSLKTTKLPLQPVKTMKTPLKTLNNFHHSLLTHTCTQTLGKSNILRTQQKHVTVLWDVRWI